MIRVTRTRLVTGLALAAIAVVALVLAAQQLDLRGHADRIIAFFRAAGPLPFFLAMAVLPGMGFPLSAFLAVAGPVFGPTMGVGAVVLCAIAAIAVNVALSYWVAARGLRPVIERLLRRMDYRIPEIPPQTAWIAILVLRIVPGTPFCLQSLLLGMARVPFGVYMLVSTLVPAAYVSAMIVLGDGLVRGDRTAMAAAGAIFVATGVVLHWLRKRYRPASAAVAGSLRTDQRS